MRRAITETALDELRQKAAVRNEADHLEVTGKSAQVEGNYEGFGGQLNAMAAQCQNSNIES